MLLVLDNRDSFTFNLVQVLEALGARVRVVRAREVDVDGVRALAPTGVLIGPGPGTPDRAGCSEAVVRELVDVPILGVCLGHQAIASALGGRLEQAELCHGQTRPVTHDGRGVFAGVPSPVELTRYNSLRVAREGLPAELEVSAVGPGGHVEGLRHRTRPLEGVQAHPESALCLEHGRRLLENFAAACSARALGRT